MPKIVSNNASNTLLKYSIRCILSSIVSIFIFSYLVSLLIYKLDLDLSFCNYAGYFIIGISACIISYISIAGIKNNLLLLSLIAQVPLIIFIIINGIINKEKFLFLLAKIILTVIISVLISLIKARKK